MIAKNFLHIFELIFDKLAGKSLWSITGGGAAGSVIQLNIGRKITRKREINNLNLTIEQRKFLGEYQIMIYTDWDLKDKNNRIVHSSNKVVSNQTLVFYSFFSDNLIIKSFYFDNDNLFINFTNYFKLVINLRRRNSDNLVVYDNNINIAYALNGNLEIETETTYEA